MHHDLDDNDDDGDDDDDHWRKLIPKYIFQLRFPILECTFPNIGKWSQEEKNPNFVSDLSNFVPTCLDLGEGVSANSVSDQECYFLS